MKQQPSRESCVAQGKTDEYSYKSSRNSPCSAPLVFSSVYRLVFWCLLTPPPKLGLQCSLRFRLVCVLSHVDLYIELYH